MLQLRAYAPAEGAESVGQQLASVGVRHVIVGGRTAEVGPGTILVGLAAGMAGMLAYEIAAGATVGVAISVTTIAAAAYVGCALGLGTTTSDTGALEVLATNLVCIVTGSTLTLIVQRYRQRATS